MHCIASIDAVIALDSVASGRATHQFEGKVAVGGDEPGYGHKDA